MRGVKASVFIVFAALLGAGIAFGVQQEASVEKGKALFNDPKLGTTGQSCNDCHPGGKGAEKGAAKKDLEDILNGCITQGLKGKALDAKSVEMQSLILYVKSLGNKPGAAPKKENRGC